MKTDATKIKELTEQLNAFERENARLRDIIAQALKEDPSSHDVYDILQAANKSTIPLIDLDQLAWSSIKRAAGESKWMPDWYMTNEWTADVRDFLRNGASQESNFGTITPT